MSKMRPKPRWWHWKTYGHVGKRDKQIENKGQRRLRERETLRDIREQA